MSQFLKEKYMGDQEKDDDHHKGKWWRYLVAGGIAGAVSRTSTAPFDRLKIYMQLHKPKGNMKTYFRIILAEGGIRGLWRGNLANVLKITPDSAIKFSVYKQVKVFMKGNEGSTMTFSERVFAGAVAGSVSQSAVYPMDLLKTRVMLRKPGQFNGMVDAVRKLYAQEGIRCFYRGFLANFVGIVPLAGIDLAVYETIRQKYFVDKKNVSIFWVLLATGCVSGTLGQIYNFPFHLIKTQLQVQETYPAWTMRQVVRKIIKQRGFFGLYQGLTPSIIKIVPSICISYVAFEYSSQFLGITIS